MFQVRTYQINHQRGRRTELLPLRQLPPPNRSNLPLDEEADLFITFFLLSSSLFSNCSMSIRSTSAMSTRPWHIESMDTDLLMGCTTSPRSSTSRLLRARPCPVAGSTGAAGGGGRGGGGGVADIAVAGVGSGEGEGRMLARQSGQLECDFNQVSMHGTWKAWPHLGRRRSLSSSMNSLKQTEQSVASTSSSPFLYLKTVMDLMTASSSPRVAILQTSPASSSGRRAPALAAALRRPARLQWRETTV